MTVTEIALTESRSLRDQYVDRTDVLDKVKALALLPDDMHATTEMVASYYEVPVKTVESLAFDNLAELQANGRHVLRGSDLREFVASFGEGANVLSPKARSLAVFSRRAVLNVGQLLRDSSVARRVRTYLLDVEAETAATIVHKPRSLPEALRAYADEIEAHERTKAALAEERPLAEAYRDLMSKDGTFDWAATAQIFSRVTSGLGRNLFLAKLRDLGILKDNNTPYQRYMKHFQVVGDTGGANAVPTTTVKPAGLDWLRVRLYAHYYPQVALFPLERGA